MISNSKSYGAMLFAMRMRNVLNIKELMANDVFSTRTKTYIIPLPDQKMSQKKHVLRRKFSNSMQILIQMRSFAT